MKKLCSNLFICPFQADELYSALNNVTDKLPQKQTVRSKVLYFYHLDHLGNVSLITDSSGSVIWPVDYDTNGPARYLPFGELYKPQSRTYDNVYSNTNLKFTSKPYDDEVKLSYFGARFMDHSRPSRFISPDPSLSTNFATENPQSFNLYVYSLNNPISRRDLSGLAEVYFLFGDLENWKYKLLWGAARAAIADAQDLAGKNNVEVIDTATNFEMKMALEDPEAKAILIFAHGGVGKPSTLDFEEQSSDKNLKYRLNDNEIRSMSKSVEYLQLSFCTSGDKKNQGWEFYAKTRNKWAWGHTYNQ